MIGMVSTATHTPHPDGELKDAQTGKPRRVTFTSKLLTWCAGIGQQIAGWMEIWVGLQPQTKPMACLPAMPIKSLWCVGRQKKGRTLSPRRGCTQ